MKRQIDRHAERPRQRVKEDKLFLILDVSDREKRAMRRKAKNSQQFSPDILTPLENERKRECQRWLEDSLESAYAVFRCDYASL